MYVRQVHICTVPRTQTEVLSQLYELQIPVMKSGEVTGFMFLH